MLLALSSCAKMPELEDTSIGSGKIILNIMTNDGPVVKSQDTDSEQKVEWLDIFIFDEANELYHKERCDKSTNPDYGYGQFVTEKQREDFGVNSKYFVFVVANCEADFSDVTNLADLQRTIVTHDNLHLSGFGYEGAPSRFIMDGVAYTGDSEPEMPMSMVLNNGDLVANTELKATLRRAASKIVVNISQGDNVEFKQELVDEGSSAAGRTAYSFYQLPIGTSVIAPLQGMASYVDAKQTTDDIQAIDNKTFFWDESNNITIIGYAYANDWSSTELTKETSLLLNIPMMWDENNDLQTDGKEAARPNNWFKIPLSRESKFDRNKCYQVNIKINAIGAETKSTAIELDDIEYVTVDWIGSVVNVGDNTNNPEYLMLNRDTVEIFNSNFDFTSLSFTSSSPIESITLKSIDGDNYSAYYYNKYNNPIELSNAIKATITATAPDGVLNGNIAITSPMMPSNQAEIDKAIAALGGAPVPPTLPEGITPPQEPDGKPVEPEVVEDPGPQPAEPDPNDYVPDTNIAYSYRYNESTGKFQRKRHLSRDWENIDDPQEYTDAVNAYNNYESLKAAYDQYVIKKEAYDAALAEWQSTDAYKQYLADLEAYENNPALKTYQELYALYETNLQAYNDAVAAIRSTANGSETHYNSIRYVEFEVKNTQGLTATFVVKQYPIIYVTNSLGWYSYRDDFKTSSTEPTTYHIMGDRISAIQYSNGVYTLKVGSSRSGSFWYSRSSNHPEADHTGTSTTYTYYWNSATSNSVTEGSGETGENTRMYHIKVSSTSSEYTVGIPRRVNVTKDINYSGTSRSVTYDTTESSEANAQLVSPSFMTASRLGILTTSNLDWSDENSESEIYDVFSYHCSNYVEVKQVVENGVVKKVVYDDWRLPTAAEINFIIGIQSTNSSDMTAAIDFLLNARYYYSASGPVYNTKGTTNGTSVRCVRDAINEPTPIGLTE